MPTSPAPPDGPPPSSSPDPVARLGREVFALGARCEAGFGELADQLARVQDALTALATRVDRADARADTLGALAVADRLAAAGVLDPLDDLIALVRARGDAVALALLQPLAASQLAALARAGITEIPAAPGTAFDPRLHDGVGARPAEATVAPGRVLDVVRRGFRWHDTVLRRAQVVLAE